MKFFHAARAIVIIALLLALLPWPLNYYEVLRCIVLVVSVMEMWHVGRAGRRLWLMAFLVVAVVFNPFHVWGFERWEWSVFDVVAIILFARGFFPSRRLA